MKTLQRLLFVLVSILILTTCSKDSSGGGNDVPDEILQYELKVTVTPEGSGTISPSSGTFNKGEQVTITATPSSERFNFKNWTGGAIGAVNSVTVTMTSNKNITANFEEIAPVYANGEGEIGAIGGTIMIEDESSPLNGISVVIPEGSLESDENIRISIAEESVEFSLDPTIEFIKFEPEGLQFSKKIEITLPYDESIQDTTNLKVINYLQNPESIVELEMKEIDEVNKTITAYTDHFSYYSVWKSNIRLNVELLNYFDDDGQKKIAARFDITGKEAGSYNYGLKHIKAYDNKSVMDWLYDSSSDLTPSSIFEVTLMEYDALSRDDEMQTKTFGIRREYRGFGNNEIWVTDREQAFPNRIYTTPEFKYVENEDISSTSLNTLGNWISGKPLILYFDEVLPKNNEKFYLRVKWGLYNIRYITDNISPIHVISSIEYKKTLNQLLPTDKDLNKNQIHDDYEEQKTKPAVITKMADEIYSTSARLNAEITTDGGAAITSKGFYASTTNPPPQNNPINAGSGTADFSSIVNFPQPGSTLHYRAFATNEIGTTLGEVLSVNAANTFPNLNVTSPVQNSSFQLGTPVIINGSATDVYGLISNVRIYIDNELKRQFTPNQANYNYSYTWNTEGETIGEHTIDVTVTDNDGDSKTQTISIDIADGNIVVNSPNENTVWEVGEQNVEISWNTGGLSGNVAIELWLEGVKIGNINSDTANDGSYSQYNVQENRDPDKDYQIKITSIDYPNKSDFSDFFEIKSTTNLAPILSNIFSPINGEDLDQDFTTLSWTASDPEDDVLTYDVYFGTSPTPSSNVSPDQPENTYTANLIAGETYFWRIIVKDDKGNITEGPIWSFTTAASQENEPPSAPSNPLPDNAAEINAGDVTFSWTSTDPDGDSLSYDVYVGMNTTPELVRSGPETSFTIRVFGDNTYNWKVIAKDNQGNITEGPPWSFTVLPEPPCQPMITINEPLPNSSYVVGSYVGYNFHVNCTDGARDNITEYNLYVDDNLIYNSSSGGNPSFSLFGDWNSTNATIGTHVLKLEAIYELYGPISSSISFEITEDPSLGELNVLTEAPTDIEAYRLTLNGNITQDGGLPILDRGFYISYDSNNPPNENQYDEVLNLGTGNVGPFTQEYFLPELGLAISYRAFAQNSNGIVLGSAVVAEYSGQAPEVVINQPANNSTYTIGSTITISGQVTMPDPNAPFAFGEIFVDGTRLDVFNEMAFSYDWDTSSSSLGSHEIAVVATDNLQQQGLASVTIELNDNQNTGDRTYVPDDNFEQALIDLGYDDIEDNYVLTANIQNLTDLILNMKGISSAQGIEDFKELKSLNLSNNQLTSLDLSQNTRLLSIIVQSNQLTSLDLSQNTLLESISAWNNQLSSLDVSQCLQLKYLFIENNELGSLNISQNTLLEGLKANFNQLSSLDVSQNTQLGYLRLRDNDLTSLDVSLNTPLYELDVLYNPLTCLKVNINQLTNGFQTFIGSTEITLSLECN